MQITDILDFILSDPLVLIAIFWIVGIIIAVVLRKRSNGSKKSKDLIESKKPKRTKIKAKGHLMKQIQKMDGQAEKGKELTVPPVRSRQEIITQLFESKTNAIGLKASTEGGFVPISHTPLARFLKDRNVAENTVSAIIVGIMEEESEADVRTIIEVAADSPEVNLTSDELEKAKELAVEEWRNVKTPSEV